MRAARRIAVPAALALALAACTDAAQQAAPRPESTSSNCAGFERFAPTSEQVQEAAEDLDAFFDRVGEEIRSQLEGSTPFVDVEAWAGFSAGIRESDFASPGQGIDPDEARLTEARIEIRRALEDTAEAIRTKLGEAIADALETATIPPRLERLTDCLGVLP
jgi:hypothetical protein